MNKLDELINRVEACNATKQCVSCDEINEILVSIGGEPICVNETEQGSQDGSLTDEINIYMSLLLVRGWVSRFHPTL